VRPGKQGGRYKGQPGRMGHHRPDRLRRQRDGHHARFYNTLVSRSNVDPNFVFYDLAQSFEQPTKSPTS
jgi:hypothetical protein